MVKNYTTIIRNVKKNYVKNMVEYLLDKDTKSHKKNNTQIYPMGNKEKFLKINQEKINLNTEIAKNRKGKKLIVSNKSLTFNFPAAYDLDLNEVEKIYKKTMSEVVKLYKSYGVEVLPQEFYSVFHNQENQHIHCVMPYLDRYGNTIRAVKSKHFLTQLKSFFTQATDQVLQKDHLEYQEQPNEDKRKRNHLREMTELKSFYLDLIPSLSDKKAIRYLTNQIKVIDRLLIRKEPENSKEVLRVFKNAQKVKDQNKSKNLIE